MNAKKIMGAVLVAFLAAALFIGAGAAAPVDGQTVFVNQKVAGLTGTWTSGTNSITAVAEGGDGYFTGSIVEGVYVNGTGNNAISITVKYPEAVISAVAGNDAEDAYQIIGSTYYMNSGVQAYSVAPAATSVGIKAVFLTLPNGKDVNITGFNKDQFKGELAYVGEYTISVIFDIANFATGTLASEVEAKPVTFKVAEAGDVTIAASVDQILRGENFMLTITGQPGVTYKVTYGDGDFAEFNAGQKGLLYATPVGVLVKDGKEYGFTFTMPNTGKVDVVIAGSNNAEDSEKITVEQPSAPEDEPNKATVTVKFNKGTITAEADAASYFVGDVVTISGTNTAGDIKGYTIKGTNFEVTVDENLGIEELADNGFEFEINTADVAYKGKKLDVGTYTVTILVGDVEKPTAKAAVAVVLKQPFISIVEAPEVIVKGDEGEFIINAEATKDAIQYYIFGTNFFLFGDNESAVQGEEIKTQYTVTLTEETTANMSAGQYFAVFQHPMYDGAYNVTVEDEESWIIESTNDVKIDVKERQTANAAQALCDELDAQNIDDMYVKASFFIVGKDESFTISNIPTSIAQGETLTISGVSTSNADEYVTVEMISTAFAAVPKETVGSAAFIAVTTQVAEDGTWEVTLDTSDLNVDEYSLKVACGDDTWKNVKINVVEAADKPETPDTPDVPDTPDTPDTPTEPETPGFGALAALAGLGAVAVLLLRRE